MKGKAMKTVNNTLKHNCERILGIATNKLSQKLQVLQKKYTNL